VLAVQLVQLRQQRITIINRKILRAEFSEAQDQRPPDRQVRFLVQPFDDNFGFRPQWRKAMEQIAPNSWIGAVLEQRPNLRWLVHSEQSDRRIRLPLRQLLFQFVLPIERQLLVDLAGENRPGPFA